MIGQQELDDGQYENIEEIEWATGCAVMIRRRIVEQVGLFDERYYMYDEDIDFSLRVRATGAKILFVPAAKVYHQVGAGIVRTGRGARDSSFADVTSPAAKFLFYHMTRNRILTMQKHGTTWRRLSFWSWMIPFWIWKSAQFVAHGRPDGIGAIVLGIADSVRGMFDDQHNEWRGM